MHIGIGKKSEMIIIKNTQIISRYSRISMARSMKAHSPGLARTIIMVPTGHFMHNPPCIAGTSLGQNYFSWSKPVRAILVLLYHVFFFTRQIQQGQHLPILPCSLFPRPKIQVNNSGAHGPILCSKT